MERRLPGLEPDEEVIERAHASFRGATAASVRSTFAMHAARRRVGAYHAWREQTEMAGLSTTGPEMIIGVTDKRLVVWSTTFFLNRPSKLVGHVPHSKVAEVATARHGIVTGLALVLHNGQIVEVEALRGRPLRRLASALRAAAAS